MAGAFPAEHSTPFIENNPRSPTTPIPQPISHPYSNAAARSTLEALFSVADITTDGGNVRTSAVLRLHAALYERIELAQRARTPPPPPQSTPADLAGLQNTITNLRNELAALKTELEKSNKTILRNAIDAAHSPSTTNASNPRDIVLQKERLLIKHMPELFKGDEDQLAVMEFLDKVEHFVRMGAGYGPLESDRCIDIVSRFVTNTVFEWLKSSWAQQHHMEVFPPSSGSFGNESAWVAFKQLFISRYITSATRQKVRTEWERFNLKPNDDIFAFNAKCRTLIRMLTDGAALSGIGRDETIFMDYIRKLPSRLNELILNNHRQRADLIRAGATISSYSLLDAMEAAEEQRTFAPSPTYG